MAGVALLRRGLGLAGRNRTLLAGLLIVLSIILFGYAGPLFVDMDKTKVGAVKPAQSPSWDHPLGTNSLGKDMLAVLVAGTPQTLKLGLIAGGVGLLIGVTLGFAGGYYGGFADAAIRLVSDVGLTIPPLAILIIIAASVRVLSVEEMALVVATTAWMFPTRTIRAQVLTLRERPFLQVAKLSGVGNMEIIVRELIPNLLPYLAASFVASVTAAILASIGLDVLGLGPQIDPPLGATIYWSLNYAAFVSGMWWWWSFPTVVFVTLFIGLFLISSGMDQVANPRLRTTV